jgi:hypothetical protein
MLGEQKKTVAHKSYHHAGPNVMMEKKDNNSLDVYG